MYSLRHIGPKDKLRDHLDGHLLTSIFPQEILDRCASQCSSPGKRRTREFTPTMFFHQLLMNSLWAHECQQSVWNIMAHHVALLNPLGTFPTMTSGAISYQRAHFETEMLHRVMTMCCKPLCEITCHPKAFYHGRRLVAIDGTKLNVPDTDANVEAFGRPSNQYGPGPNPQMQAVVLMECGSRCVLDVAFGTHAQAEIHALPALLPRMDAGMLVLTDSGFFSTWFWEQLQDTVGADALCALSSTIGLKVEKRLSDGSYLTTVKPNKRKEGYRGTRPITVRVIEYVVDDPRLGKVGRCYRLATTLLDEHEYPASELLIVYRKRWEVETMFREIKSSLRERLKVLRSLTPAGVRQDVYALFLVHYTVGSLKVEAAAHRQVDPNRISFTEVKNRLKTAISDSLLADPSCQEWLWSQLTRHIALAPLLPEDRFRLNRREIKLYYQKWHRKKRGIPPLEAYGSDETFLSRVKIWERPEGVRPTGKDRGRKTSPETQEISA